jgi:hypothetical protein
MSCPNPPIIQIQESKIQCSSHLSANPFQLGVSQQGWIWKIKWQRDQTLQYQLLKIMGLFAQQLCSTEMQVVPTNILTWLQSGSTKFRLHHMWVGLDYWHVPKTTCLRSNQNIDASCAFLWVFDVVWCLVFCILANLKKFLSSRIPSGGARLGGPAGKGKRPRNSTTRGNGCRMLQNAVNFRWL